MFRSATDAIVEVTDRVELCADGSVVLCRRVTLSTDTAQPFDYTRNEWVGPACEPVFSVADPANVGLVQIPPIGGEPALVHTWELSGTFGPNAAPELTITVPLAPPSSDAPLTFEFGFEPDAMVLYEVEVVPPFPEVTAADAYTYSIDPAAFFEDLRRDDTTGTLTWQAKPVAPNQTGRLRFRFVFSRALKTTHLLAFYEEQGT